MIRINTIGAKIAPMVFIRIMFAFFWIMDAVKQPEKRNSATGNVEISELFRRIGQGEKNALFELYDRTGGLIYGMALKILGNPADAEEALLSIYARIWEDSVSYNKDFPPLACLVIIARAHAHTRLYETHRPYAPLPSTAAAGVVDKNALSREQEDARARLETLAPKQREVLDWAFFSGLSAEEIAVRTGIAAGAVKTHVRIGLNRLGKNPELLKINPESAHLQPAPPGEANGDTP